VKSLLRVSWLVLVIVASFALFNYPRSWWQELISQTSPWWSLLFIGTLCTQLRQAARVRFSYTGVILVVLQGLCIVKVVRVLGPYAYAPPKTYVSLEYSAPTRFILVNLKEGAPQVAVQELNSMIATEAPDVLIETKNVETPPMDNLRGRYPFILESSGSSGRMVAIYSNFPYESPYRTDYGYGALPAILGRFKVGEGTYFQLGAFGLLPSDSQDSFNMSRLTSRRLASALKFSSEPRIVAGSFRAPVTSQIVDMYVDQLKLRSVFFDAGLFGALKLLGRSIGFGPHLNIFTARNIQVRDVREVPSKSPDLTAILFAARIPRSS